MVSSFLSLAPIVLLAASQVSALATGQTLRARSLIARQTTDEYPPECADTCTAMETAFSESCASDPSCICTDENMTTYVACMNCILSEVPPEIAGPLAEDGNDALDLVVQACAGEGHTLAPPPTIGDGSTGGGSTGGGSDGGSDSGAGDGGSVGGGGVGGGDTDPAEGDDEVTSPGAGNGAGGDNNAPSPRPNTPGGSGSSDNTDSEETTEEGSAAGVRLSSGLLVSAAAALMIAL